MGIHMQQHMLASRKHDIAIGIDSILIEMQPVCVMADDLGLERQRRSIYAFVQLWTYNNERPNMGIGGVKTAMKLKMAA